MQFSSELYYMDKTAQLFAQIPSQAYDLDSCP